MNVKLSKRDVKLNILVKKMYKTDALYGHKQPY